MYRTFLDTVIYHFLLYQNALECTDLFISPGKACVLLLKAKFSPFDLYFDRHLNITFLAWNSTSIFLVYVDGRIFCNDSVDHLILISV